MKSFIAAIVIVIALAGCKTVGTEFDMNRVDEMKPGVTTLAEATELLGKPANVNYSPDGGKLAQWSFIKAQYLGKSSSGRLAVVFDKDDKMVRIAQRGER